MFLFSDQYESPGIIRILDVPNIKDNKNFEGMILSKPDGWEC